MKKIIFLLQFTFLLFAACKNSIKDNKETGSASTVGNSSTFVEGTNGEAYKNAIQYNDFIVNKQTEVAKQIMQFAAESQTDLNTAEQTINQAVSKVSQTITAIEGMPDWKGNTALRDSALSLFRFYKTIFSDDYRRIIAMQKDGTVSQEEKTEYYQITQKINSSEAKLDAGFKTAQKDFALQNGFKVATNELQGKIDEMKKAQ